MDTIEIDELENITKNDLVELSINTLEEEIEKDIKIENSIECECGSHILKKSVKKHYKSIRHEIFLLKKRIERLDYLADEMTYEHNPLMEKSI